MRGVYLSLIFMVLIVASIGIQASDRFAVIRVPPERQSRTAL